MKSEVYKEKVNTGDELFPRIMNSAALIKQERQDDLGSATRTIAKRVKKCIEIDGGIFVHLLGTVAMAGFLNTYCELLQFNEIIYISNKCK
jgi:hypothetical protein